MKFHATAPAFSAESQKLSGSFCPECHDLMVAASMSEHVNRHEVRHFWACESCGHEFRTIVRLPELVIEGCCVA